MVLSKDITNTLKGDIDEIWNEKNGNVDHWWRTEEIKRDLIEKQRWNLWEEQIARFVHLFDSSFSNLNEPQDAVKGTLWSVQDSKQPLEMERQLKRCWLTLYGSKETWREFAGVELFGKTEGNGTSGFHQGDISLVSWQTEAILSLSSHRRRSVK
jgi:hypothetical protein